MEHHSSTAVALPPPQNNNKHDIFLSHCGKQKGFARDLFTRLCSPGYSVFFDENDDSLPPGEAFPPLIFSAANACDLALVVISDDFLRSKWPMMELCAFVDRLSPGSDRSPDDPHFTILPLFFTLPIEGIKDEKNVEKWQKVWESFERINGRISAAKCEEAVSKVLPTLNGVVRGSESLQGESSYIDEVVDRVSCILPPRDLVPFREGVDPHKHHVGKERLCQVILDEFRKLEEEHDSSPSKVNILGMYGVPGSGKSTLCDFLRESMFEEFGRKVIYLKLPTESREGDDLQVKEQYVKLLSMLIPHQKGFASMDLDKLYRQLFFVGARFSHKMFLVLDNMAPSNCKRYKMMLTGIVSSGILGAGSRVMLVAQSSVILETSLVDVKKHMYSHALIEVPSHALIEVPRLTTEEAMEVIRNCYPSAKDDLLSNLLHKCSFPSSSFMYIPFVFEQIGILLRVKGFTEVELIWKTVEEGKKCAIEMLVDTNFKQLPEDLRELFFDIALFLIPAGYSKLSDATPVLCRMRKIPMSDSSQIEWKITELRKYCAVSVMGDELSVHDIFTEYARSIPGNSERYLNQPSLNISDFLVNNYIDPRGIHLRCLEARTIHMTLGTCKGWPYYPDGDEEVRLYVEVGGRARAVHVRNFSRYSKCILVLAGDSSSLVCLRTENVQLQVNVASSSSASADGISNANLSNLVRLEIRNDEDKFRKMSLSGVKRKQMSSSFDFVSHKIQKTLGSMTRWLWIPFFPCRQPCLSGTDNQQHVRSYVIITRRMPWLRVLSLVIVGTVRLEIAFPELEELEIENEWHELTDVKIYDAPMLRKLKLVVKRYYDDFGFRPQERYPISIDRRKLMLQLRKCPELREVRVDGSFDQVSIAGLLPSKLRELSLAINDRRDEFIPTNLIRSSMHQLSQLETLRLSECRGVENLEFTHEYLPCLRTMVVKWCASLARLCIGPGCMPNLVELVVSCCDKLQVIEGLEDLLMQQQLKSLSLYYLSQLRCEWDVMRLGGSLNCKSILM